MSAPVIRTLTVLAILACSPFARAEDTDTDTDTDTDPIDTDTDLLDDPIDTGSDLGPTYAAHDLAGEQGGSACMDGWALGALLLPLALGIPGRRRPR